MPTLETLIELVAGQEPLVHGSALGGAEEFERGSPSWGLSGAAAAAAGEPHIETVDGIPALFLGRRTRNLLGPEFAPFRDVPALWRTMAEVSHVPPPSRRLPEGQQDAGVTSATEAVGLSFGSGSLRADASRGTVLLPLPPVAVHPADEVPLPGTAQLGALYQFSAYLRGTGTATLTLRDTRNNIAAEKRVALGAVWQRPCVALDGPFAERVLAGAITIEGGTAFLDGLLLEPYVVTHRSVGRAALVPAPGNWVPGGERRERDRLVLPVAEGAVPRAGLVDFWFRPAWHALHPQHTFFQMCHWYFAFELRAAGPEFYAGQKACPWMYYWEWGLGQGYEPDTWHHYAVSWREDGSATIYFDGQPRAHIEQARPHALDPALAGSRLAIGGPLGEGMSLDPNVPAQLDAYLARWRLQAGEATPHDVLVAMEESDPRRLRGEGEAPAEVMPQSRVAQWESQFVVRPLGRTVFGVRAEARTTNILAPAPPPVTEALPAEPSRCPRSVPERAVFLVERHRALIDRAQEHCWFVHNLFQMGPTLYAAIGRGDDTSASPNRRQNTSTRPGLMESRDRGRTWQPSAMAFRREGARLPDGRRVTVPFLLVPPPSRRQYGASLRDAIESASARRTTEIEPFSCEARIEEPGGAVRTIAATFDVSSLPEWAPGAYLATCQLLPRRDGSFLLFAYTSLPNEGGSSVVVFRSDDLSHWRAIARPYRPDGLTETGPNETAAVEFPDGRILAMMRTGGWNQLLAKGFSEDGGRTWSPMMPSGLCGVQPRLHLARDGVLYLVTGRPGIVLAASTDCGETFEACACAEDDRIHEFVPEFGWYGYSSMNNGFVVDEEAGEAYVSYDLLGERLPGDGTSTNACYVRPYGIRHFADYRAAVAEALAPDAAALEREGDWQTVPGVVAVTSQTGAALSGIFRGTGLVALIETSPQGGRAVVHVTPASCWPLGAAEAAAVRANGGPSRTISLYFPQRRIQRLLLADGLSEGTHRFRLRLESGSDPAHQFANPEMPMLGGLQTVYLAGVDASRRLAVYGFEVLRA